jgi:serine protease Do
MQMLFLLFGCCTFPLLETKDFSADLQRSTLAATVRVVENEKKSFGSGVLIGVRENQGYILTARHTITSRGRFEVQFFTEESYPKAAFSVVASRVIHENSDADLALLTIDLSDKKFPSPLSVAMESPKEKEFSCLSCGGSLGESPTIETAVVRNRILLQRPNNSSAFFWQTKEAPVKGRSGGPLINTDGKVIGIASGEQEGQGYYTHLDEIRTWLRKTDEGKWRWLILDQKQVKEK